MPVDRRAGDAELVGDLLDGVRPATVGAGLVVHRLRDLGLTRGELGTLAPGAAPGASRFQAVAGPLRHQGVLELGDGPEDLKEHTAVAVSMPWSRTTRL